MQKHVNLVDLVKSFPTNIYLQNLASIQKKTSPTKFAHLAEKSANGSISNLSTKVRAAEKWRGQLAALDLRCYFENFPLEGQRTPFSKRPTYLPRAAKRRFSFKNRLREYSREWTFQSLAYLLPTSDLFPSAHPSTLRCPGPING